MRGRPCEVKGVQRLEHVPLATKALRVRAPRAPAQRGAPLLQFETMIESNQIKEFRCFYDTRKQIFYSVVALGK